MEIIVDRVGEVTVLTLAIEELDAGNAAEFKREIAAVLDSDTKVIFDLERLRFIDSSGLGAMLSCLRQLQTNGGDLKLCAISKPVGAVFELVRMDRVFEIYDSRDEALQSFPESRIGSAAG